MATDPLLVTGTNPDVAIADVDGDEVGEAIAATEDALRPAEPTGLQKLLILARAEGNIAQALSEELLSRIGHDCVADYEQDNNDREEWKKIAEAGLDAAAQAEKVAAKNFPWPKAANIKYPILTEAVLQFNARMYPAVVKGDEAVLCKVIGQDNGRARMAPNPVTGEMNPLPKLDPQTGQPPVGPDGNPILEPDWITPPGAKAKRARRVSEYMNTTIFYRMTDWESDTDTLLMQLPAVGTAFRKVWWDGRRYKPCAALTPAMRLVAPKGAKDCKSAPRLTEEIPDVPYRDILSKMRADYYLTQDLGISAEDLLSNTRMLLEQHCYLDLDEDGFGEPYIVTIDYETHTVLRIEPNFSEDDIEFSEFGEVIDIRKGQFFVKYGLFPDPKGGFYDLGLAHLLKMLMGVIDASINQLIDAGTAQTAGGGFIGSGVRLQGGKSGTVRIAPGEYKTVPISGTNLREAIVEKTLPNVSPVTFQVLELIMGAAQSIAGAKDVITGDASNTGQVGTTLALIEQGLQVFNATAKRVFRSLKEEFTLLRDVMGKYGGERMARDYVMVLDDEEADFEKDFAGEDFDIRPVSDPSSVTRMQKLAKAQFVMGTIPILAQVGGDAREALRRTYEAVDAEDIDKLLPPPPPPMPDPKAEADAVATQAEAAKDMKQAEKVEAETVKIGMDTIEQKQRIENEATEAGARAALVEAAAQTFGALGMGRPA